MSATTQAGDWFAARQRGERLPEHLLRCDYCAEQASDADLIEAIDEVICPNCMERMVEDAPAIDARSEVGLVGGGGCWS